MSCTHKRELGQRRGADVGFRANTGHKSTHLGTSAYSHNRTSSGASEVQNRVYGKPPMKQLIRPQEYCGTGTGAKDVQKTVEAVEKVGGLNGGFGSGFGSFLYASLYTSIRAGLAFTKFDLNRPGFAKKPLQGPAAEGLDGAFPVRIEFHIYKNFFYMMNF